MSGWRAAIVALLVGGLVLVAGMVLPGLTLGGDPGPEEPAVESGVTLVCAPVLETACRQVAETVEVSFQAWSAGDPLPERGVVLAPAAELPPEAELGGVVAESPIVIGAWRERAQVLAADCGGVSLPCIGDALGRTWEEVGGDDAWGDFKIGLADPAASEAGMLAWAVAADLADDSALARSLRLTAPTDARLTADLVAFGDSRADVVITTEAAVAGQMENAIGRGGRLEVYYPEVSPWVEYVAVAQGRGSGELAGFLGSPEGRAILAGAGVRPAGGDGTGLPEGLGPPGTRGAAPDPGTRATLIERWNDL